MTPESGGTDARLSVLLACVLGLVVVVAWAATGVAR